MRNPVNHTFTGFLVEVSTQKVESEATLKRKTSTNANPLILAKFSFNFNNDKALKLI